ncbi:MAG: hypothetical protein NT027_01325 [Proteobacteria bacterium]|nr:hypothetical protein [Pseudomonadota bacterium]
MNKIIQICMLGVFAGLTANLFPSKAHCRVASKSTFEMKEAPSPSDWKRFHLMTPLDKNALWKSQATQHQTLRNWAWQWRIGWLQSCSTDQSNLVMCDMIIEQGLTDKAMVVRQSAVRAFAIKYKDKPSLRHLEILSNMFHKVENYRNGKPLPVCDEIVRALMTMQHPKAQNIAKKLASKHPRIAHLQQGLARQTKKF